MKAYAYYPGCSLEKNAHSYHQSLIAVARRLNLHFDEVEDWNCCGATEYIALAVLPAYALVARNLALAAPDNGAHAQLVAPCSACFLNLRKADEYLQRRPDMAQKVNVALAEGGLHYDPGSVKVRHLLEVMVRDVGFDAVANQVTRPLTGLRVAPYYGCLIVRPGFDDAFDDPEYPTTMDRLLDVIGASVVDYPVKAHCCGGHMTQIGEEIALELLRRLLKSASDEGADVIATLCPMCQLNLDAYQDAVNRHFGTDYHIPILYFTQLMALAFGLLPEAAGIGQEFVEARPALARIGSEREEEEKKPPARARRRDKDALPMPAMPEEG